jgi:hypothetical protein
MIRSNNLLVRFSSRLFKLDYVIWTYYKLEQIGPYSPLSQVLII